MTDESIVCWDQSWGNCFSFPCSLSDSEEDEAREQIMTRFNLTDIHQLDVDSKEFKRLPKDIQVGEHQKQLFHQYIFLE
jgi:hypothetical protein